MLCYTILHYTILYYTILCYSMLCYSILHYTILYYTMLYSPVIKLTTSPTKVQMTKAFVASHWYDKLYIALNPV